MIFRESFLKRASLNLRLFLALTAAIFAASASAAAPTIEQASPSAFVKSHILNSNGELVDSETVNVAEAVRLVVDIYSPTWFARAPSVDSFSVAGALLLRTEKFATNFSESIDGHNYTVQRWEYRLYPQRTGQFVIPSTSVKVSSATPGRNQPVEHKLRTAPLLLLAQALPKAPPFASTLKGQTLAESKLNNNQSRIVSASSLDMRQQVQQASRDLYPGDAIVRRITIEAEDTLGMLIPAVYWPAVDNVKQESAPDKVFDRNHRGQITGIRQEQRSYIFTQPGTYPLPPLQLRWWDAEQEQWQVESLPGETVTIYAANSEATSPNWTQQFVNEIHKDFSELPLWQQLALVLGVSSLLLVLALRRNIMRLWRRFQTSEPGRYWHLRRGIATQTPREILRRYYQWNTYSQWSTYSQSRTDRQRHIDLQRHNDQQRPPKDRENHSAAKPGVTGMIDDERDSVLAQLYQSEQPRLSPEQRSKVIELCQEIRSDYKRQRRNQISRLSEPNNSLASTVNPWS